VSKYLDEGPRYPKPLSLEHRLLIETLTTKYESVEAPFMVIDRGDYVILKHAQTIRRATPYIREPQSAEA
jgi:hypothetical protein